MGADFGIAISGFRVKERKVGTLQGQGTRIKVGRSVIDMANLQCVHNRLLHYLVAQITKVVPSVLVAATMSSDSLGQEQTKQSCLHQCMKSPMTLCRARGISQLQTALAQGFWAQHPILRFMLRRYMIYVWQHQ